MNTSISTKPGCLTPLQIAEVAEDLVEALEAGSRLAHIAGCERCAGELRQVRQLFERDLTPAEAELLAESLAHPPKPRVARRSAWPMWGAAAAAVLFATLGGGWFLANRTDPVAGLLAEASGVERPFDWRLPQAAYGPVQVQRSGEGVNPATALLEAQAALAQRAGASDAEFLRLRGWSEMLDHRMDEAVKTLEQARRLAPEDLEIAGLLGVAYAARPVADEGLAMEQFARVLARRPQDGSALFNRALLHRRAGRTREAMADWQRFLRVEGGGPWSAEVRGYVADGEPKLR